MLEWWKAHTISDRGALVVAGALLCFYLIWVLYVLYAKTPKADRAEAVGCFGFAGVVVVILGIVLLVAWFFQVGWLIRTVAALAAFPLVWTAMQLVYERLVGRGRHLKQRDP
jgi:predicted tellurium resistance membrane protein TerC